jgi:hypothetical protein
MPDGTTPFISAWLIDRTGDLRAPSLCLMLAALLSIAAVLIMRRVNQGTSAKRIRNRLLLLRRLLPRRRVRLRPRLEPQLSQVRAVALGQAEGLVAAGKILRRAMHVRGLVPGRRM